MSRWIFSLLFLFLSVFLRDSDHKMSVVNSCATMRTSYCCCPSPGCFFVSVGEWGMGVGAIGVGHNVANKKRLE